MGSQAHTHIAATTPHSGEGFVESEVGSDERDTPVAIVRGDRADHRSQHLRPLWEGAYDMGLWNRFYGCERSGEGESEANEGSVVKFLHDMFWLPWSEYLKVVLSAALAMYALVFVLLTFLGERVLP